MFQVNKNKNGVLVYQAHHFIFGSKVHYLSICKALYGIDSIAIV
jgi:hypothetical protein